MPCRGQAQVHPKPDCKAPSPVEALAIEARAGLDVERSHTGGLASIDIATVIEKAAGVRIGKKQP